jgi:hypothetical protein
MLKDYAADPFPSIRLLDNTTMSIRVIDGALRLFLTLENGRETSRAITKEAAKDYWERRRTHFVIDLLADMRSELGS